MKSSKGFTLVEALLAAIVFAVIGVIAVNVLSNIFQGSNKAQIISKVKQNGQSALNIIDNNVRNADSIICPTNDVTSYTLVTSRNGVLTRFRIFTQETLTSSNGYISQDSPTLEDSTPAELCSDDALLTQPIKITDTDNVNGVSVVDGGFTSNPKAGYQDIVSISFSLGPAVNAGKSADNQIQNVNFSTIVTLKDY